MAIKRYTATADTTITNAFKPTLKTRGTGSNMGASDVMEVFSIYGHANTSSLEKSRALINFPISNMNTDRTNGDLPESGSVKFYLRVFNCPHGQTLPKNYKLAVLPLSRSWDEGAGLDMEEYTHEEPTNWEIANSTLIAASASFTFSATAENNSYIILTSSDGTALGYKAVNGATNGDLVGGDGHFSTFVKFNNGASAAASATNLQTTINHARGHNAGTANSKITVSLDTAAVSLVQTSPGGKGNTVITTGGSFTDSTNPNPGTSFAGGGKTRWNTQGGDYHEVGYTAGKNLPHYSQTLDSGTEDININITALVEEWMVTKVNGGDPDRNNYGVIIKLSGSFEEGNNEKSYYTKKFFTRTSENFYKRPIIEARWDSSIRDDRNNFFLSSSLVMPQDNLNSLYLYNIVKGKLQNIPTLRLKTNVPANTGSVQHYNTKIFVRIYPSGNVGVDRLRPKRLPVGGGVSVNNTTTITGSWVATGIYSASFAFTGSEKEVFDVWSAGPGGDDQLVTGSVFAVKKFASQDYNPGTSYVTSITNLKSYYSQSDRVRFRTYIRQKNWQPNIYTVAKNKADNTIIENAFYRVFRIIDDYDVVQFGTGSGQQNNYTRLSYDKEGNYFDLDMSLFESGYSYAIQFAYDTDGKHVIQNKVHKFRVEK